MIRSVLTFTALASVLVLPLAAHADTLDDFVLTGAGHTVSYSLPSMTTFQDDPSVEFFFATAPNATIDGVSGYSLFGQYDAIPSEIGTLQLDLPESIFGYSGGILFQGPQLDSYVYVPSGDQANPFNIVATFLPGTYDLMGTGVTLGSSGQGPSLPYTLTIASHTATPTTVTPEPSSLLLLATGMFGLIGFKAMRPRRFDWLS